MHHNSQSMTCLCTTLRKASRAVTRAYDEALEETGMTIVQFSVLRQLLKHGDLPLSRLAELLVMDRTALYRTLGPIGRQGWVAIEDGEGRAKTALLTDEGRRALAAATPGWEVAQAALLNGIGMEEWRAIEQSLGRIADVARKRAA